MFGLQLVQLIQKIAINANSDYVIINNYVMIILIILQCLSAKDNSRLYLFVFHLTTLTRWIGKRSTNVVKCFSSCAGVCYLLNLCMRMCYGSRC